jgi:tRNA (uracil-5-)-methyltransferase
VGPHCAASLFPRFDRILYISCNPATLAADVAGLTGEGGSHAPVAAALFDQFPYTDHIEAGLLLERKKE